MTSRLEAYEIFTNPYDLEIIIGKIKGNDKYAFAISRGPGHNFKLLIDSEPFAETSEEAVKVVKEFLDSIQQFVTKEANDPKSLISTFLNPDNEEIDESKILTPDLINKIAEDLQKKQVASTYKYKKIDQTPAKVH